jgi:sortase A
MSRRILEQTLWVAALVALSAFVFERMQTWFFQSYNAWELAPMLSELPADGPSAVRHAAIAKGQPLGRLEIPSIELSAIFFEGADARTLRRGVGHIPGTALPGSPGNSGLSAHRVTFFRRLGEIEEGDEIRIVTLEGTYQYVVEATGVVDPEESIVLRDIGRPVLTLVTCYPFWTLGPAPRRFIIHAALVSD